jgi:hypothetical protein
MFRFFLLQNFFILKKGSLFLFLISATSIANGINEISPVTCFNQFIGKMPNCKTVFSVSIVTRFLGLEERTTPFMAS